MLLSDVRHADRPKNIRIHLAVSHVRFYLLRFNSSGNFCDRGASDEKRKLEQEKHCRKATIANATGLRALTAIAAAVQTRLMKLDLFFVAKRLAFLSDENRLTWFCRDKEVRTERVLM
jgi:hypothetical protein